MGLFSRLCCYYLKESACNVCVNELQPGDKVKDINPECKEKNAKGIVKSVKKVKDGNKIAGNLIEFEVENKGQHYKPGQKLKKTEIQLKKLKESFRVFISETTLSMPNFNSRPPRIDTLIKKLENKEPFVKAGESEPTLVIDVDSQWLQDLKASKRITTSYIPTIDGDVVKFSSLQKTAEFGSYSQRGADLEEKLYNALTDLLKEGQPKVKFKDTEYVIKGVERPAMQKNILADLVVDTEDGEIFLSLKKNNFFSYGGITYAGRDYQKEVSQLKTVKDFISKLRKYLNSKGKCSEVGDKIICDPGGKRYYLEPKYDQKFIDFVLFGDEKFKEDRDYVDYIIIEGSAGAPVFELQDGVHVMHASYKVKQRGDKLDAPDMPVLLARPREGKMDRYGFKNNRNLIGRKKFMGRALNLNELV